MKQGIMNYPSGAVNFTDTTNEAETDLNTISDKVTRVLLSCGTFAHLNHAASYIDRTMEYIRSMNLLDAEDAEIYHANLRGRLKMRIADFNC